MTVHFAGLLFVEELFSLLCMEISYIIILRGKYKLKQGQFIDIISRGKIVLPF